MFIYILLMVLFILCACVLYSLRDNMYSTITGASEYDLNSELDPAVEQILSYLQPYLDETGTSGCNNLIEHLHKFHNMSKKEKQLIKDKLKLLEFNYIKPTNRRYLAFLIQHIIKFNPIFTPIDFTESNMITYSVFCKAPVKALLADTIHPFSRSDVNKISNLLPHMSQKQKDEILSHIQVKHRLYKLKSNYASKSISAIKKAPTDSAFEPDLIALMPIIEDLSKKDQKENQKEHQKDQYKIIEKLLLQLKALRLLDQVDFAKNPPYTLEDLQNILSNLPTLHKQREQILQQEITNLREQLHICQNKTNTEMSREDYQALQAIITDLETKLKKTEDEYKLCIDTVIQNETVLKDNTETN